MAERRAGRGYFTTRGRREALRARINHMRAHKWLNDESPPDDPRWAEYYYLLSLRMEQRRFGATLLVAP